MFGVSSTENRNGSFQRSWICHIKWYHLVRDSRIMDKYSYPLLSTYLIKITSRTVVVVSVYITYTIISLVRVGWISWFFIGPIKLMSCLTSWRNKSLLFDGVYQTFYSLYLPSNSFRVFWNYWNNAIYIMWINRYVSNISI